ncbi:MAG: hypothetical protein ACP5NS_03655 [Candidatus Pacearchaeota archaeon]
MKYNKLPRKGQAWGFDLMIATMIFVTGIVIFYVYTLNYPKETQEKLDKLNYAGDNIAQNLLDSGYPDSWTTTTVSRIGLTNENKINQTKLDEFFLLADETTNPLGYAKAKSLFGTGYNFFVNFSVPLTIDGSAQNGIGKDFSGQTTTSLVKITRLTIYENKATTLYVYVWEE